MTDVSRAREPGIWTYVRELRRDVDRLLRRARHPQEVVYEIKVFADDEDVVAGDTAFFLEVPVHANEYVLTSVGAYLTTTGSGATTVQVRHDANGDMLSTAMTIDSGERSTLTAATPPVINTAVRRVAWGDFIHIDVDTVAAGSQGLAIKLAFRIG